MKFILLILAHLLILLLLLLLYKALRNTYPTGVTDYFAGKKNKAVFQGNILLPCQGKGQLLANWKLRESI